MAVSRLLSRIQMHAAGRDAIACRLPDRGGDALTYASLWCAATLYAGMLRERGVAAGDRVAVVMTTQREIVILIVALLRLGASLVPVVPRRTAATSFEVDGTVNAVSCSGARFFVAEQSMLSEHEAALALCRRPVRPLALESLATAPPTGPVDIDVSDDWPALIQFSSGSTSVPKGIVISRANLAANVEAIVERLGISRHDHILTWLPLFHDFGLVGSLLTALYAGCTVTAHQPITVIRDPLAWIRALSTAGATLTGAPQFAYSLCVKKQSAPGALDGIDLSSLRVALNAGETVDWPTVQRFQQRFSVFGLRPDVVQPAYGLAENTVAACLRQPGSPVPVRACDASGRLLVGCGAPVSGTRVRIKSDATGQHDAQTGEIHIQGTSMARGYMTDAAEIVETAPEGWLATGDLGAIVNDEIYVSGRTKEVFKFAGRLYSPVDVERYAAAVLPDDSRCAVMAFAYYDVESASDQVVVLIEQAGRLSDNAHREGSAEVRLAVSRELRLPLKAVHFVRRGTLPRTSSGKFKRTFAAHLYATGRFDAVATMLS